MGNLRRSLRALEKKHGMSVHLLATFLSVNPCECDRIRRRGGRGPCLRCKCQAYLDDVNALLGIEPRTEKSA